MAKSSNKVMLLDSLLVAFVVVLQKLYLLKINLRQFKATTFMNFILPDHLTPSTSRVLSAQLFARVLKADALDSTFLISLSTSSKSLPFTAFSSLDTGAREDWDGLIGRTTPADSDDSFLFPSPIPEGKK